MPSACAKSTEVSSCMHHRNRHTPHGHKQSQIYFHMRSEARLSLWLPRFGEISVWNYDSEIVDTRQCAKYETALPPVGFHIEQ